MFHTHTHIRIKVRRSWTKHVKTCMTTHCVTVVGMTSEFERNFYLLEVLEYLSTLLQDIWGRFDISHKFLHLHPESFSVCHLELNSTKSRSLPLLQALYVTMPTARFHKVRTAAAWHAKGKLCSCKLIALYLNDLNDSWEARGWWEACLWEITWTEGFCSNQPKDFHHHSSQEGVGRGGHSNIPIENGKYENMKSMWRYFRNI